MMKINKIFIPVVASAMLLTGCDDQIMQWGKPADHADVTASDIPLAVKEVIANYDNIKEYAQQYTPNMIIGIGMGASLYVNNENGEGDLANANYQMFTPGNAMKGDALMQSNGSLDFTTLDNLISMLDGKMKLYGHNFFWHTQQNQTYLKSVIAPKMVVHTSGDDNIENIVTNSDFEDGTTTGYQGFWCDYTYDVASPGHDSGKCLHIKTGKPSNMWDAQLFWGVDGLQAGTTYAYSFYAKSDCGLKMQFIGSQSASPYSGFYGANFNAGSDWTLCQGEFTYDGSPENIGRVGIQFGGVSGANLWIDDFRFGKKIEDPMTNIITNSDFEKGDDTGWQGWSEYSRKVVEGGHGGKYALQCTMSSASSKNYDCQLWWPLPQNLEAGTIYSYSFYIKSPDEVTAQFVGQNSKYDGIYKESFTAPSEWMKCEGEFTYSGSPADVCRIGIQFGGKPNSVLYVDDFKFGKKKDQTASTRSIGTRAGSTTITYEIKTPAEKQALLEGVMETWVKGVADHLKEKGITPYGYDVVNEPISDGSNKFRGLDEGVFGGSWTEDDVTHYDEAPVETEADGLTLNWGNNHWYWGYYVPDYHVKAFQLARKYLPAETKLFVNDYNLETSPEKLAALIKFAKEIDEKNGSPIVDGIGTQMHVTLSCSDDADKNAESLAALKEKVDAMFKTMAATGKLVRVTELDISVNTGSPSSNQYKAQSDAYKMIMESYKANVPEAQQSGITIWSLSDNEAEHEYWLKGQVPNLFDTTYKRKWAYKGFCDGIAGEDLGLKMGGEAYKAYYEKNNVSSSVDK